MAVLGTLIESGVAVMTRVPALGMNAVGLMAGGEVCMRGASKMLEVFGFNFAQSQFKGKHAGAFNKSSTVRNLKDLARPFGKGEWVNERDEQGGEVTVWKYSNTLPSVLKSGLVAVLLSTAILEGMHLLSPTPSIYNNVLQPFSWINLRSQSLLETYGLDKVVLGHINAGISKVWNRG